jgi:hypothetical protein
MLLLLCENVAAGGKFYHPESKARLSKSFRNRLFAAWHDRRMISEANPTA